MTVRQKPTPVVLSMAQVSRASRALLFVGEGPVWIFHPPGQRVLDLSVIGPTCSLSIDLPFASKREEEPPFVHFPQAWVEIDAMKAFDGLGERPGTATFTRTRTGVKVEGAGLARALTMREVESPEKLLPILPTGEAERDDEQALGEAQDAFGALIESGKPDLYAVGTAAIAILQHLQPVAVQRARWPNQGIERLSGQYDGLGFHFTYRVPGVLP